MTKLNSFTTDYLITLTFQKEEQGAAGERDRRAGADRAGVLPRPQADVAGGHRHMTSILRGEGGGVKRCPNFEVV